MLIPVIFRLIAAVAVSLIILSVPTRIEVQETLEGYSPCCSLPCENGGVCEENGPEWVCDCRHTGHSGERCQTATWRCWLSDLAVSAVDAIPGGWLVVNQLPLLLRMVVGFTRCKTQYLVTSAWAGAGPSNMSSARLLPPIPVHCPTAMGVKGPKQLPSEEEVFTLLLARRAFQPDDSGASLLLTAFARHFMHQFLPDEAGDGDSQEAPKALQVDASQVYGFSPQRSLLLRSRQGGRLLSRTILDQEFPACVEDAPVTMLYPSGPRRQLPYFLLTGPAKEVEPRWALGHPHLASSPLVFSMAVLWLREHNRVAGLLARQNPQWDDERLYRAARKVVNGEMIQIALHEFLPRLSASAAPQPSPKNTPLPLPAEFSFVTFWGWQLPDELLVQNEARNLTDFMFTNQRLVLELGLAAFVDMLATQHAGKPGAWNHGALVKGRTKRLMRAARQQRTQPLNRYRHLVGLRPARSFLDLAGDPALANELQRLYVDVDAVELYPGLLVEQAQPGALLPPTLRALIVPWLLAALSSSPLGAPSSWTPESFDGALGWDEVQDASLHKLVCSNVGGACDSAGSDVPDEKAWCGMHASWSVPPPGAVPVAPNSCRLWYGQDHVSASLACNLEDAWTGMSGFRLTAKAAVDL